MTDGYARALALEGEHLRIARELGAAAADASRNAVDRLGALAERLATTEGELERLRARLVPLRDRTEALASLTRSRS